MLVRGASSTEMPTSRNGQPRRRFPPEILSDAEVCRLFDACDDRQPTGVRNQALIAILYRGGLRINEASDVFQTSATSTRRL